MPYHSSERDTKGSKELIVKHHWMKRRQRFPSRSYWSIIISSVSCGAKWQNRLERMHGAKPRVYISSMNFDRRGHVVAAGMKCLGRKCSGGSNHKRSSSALVIQEAAVPGLSRSTSPKRNVDLHVQHTLARYSSLASRAAMHGLSWVPVEPIGLWHDAVRYRAEGGLRDYGDALRKMSACYSESALR